MPVTNLAEDLPANSGGAAALVRDIERLGARRGQRHHPQRPDRRGFLVVGDQVTRLAPLNPKLPSHIRERVTVFTAASFTDYAEPFVIENQSRMFVDVAAPKVTLDFDYHTPGAADHRGHILTWHMRTSLNWQRWTSIDGSRSRSAHSWSSSKKTRATCASLAARRCARSSRRSRAQRASRSRARRASSMATSS